MAWTLYQSTDGSAPVLTGENGKLTDLLDAILVNGYGAKPAAGWSIAFTGTNKRAYRNGAGATSRKYIRVVDDGSVPTAAAKEAFIRGYDSMTDVDTGADPFPTVAQVATNSGQMVIRKSAAADTTARAWIAVADDRTLIMCIANGDQAGEYDGFYAGEFYSTIAGDAHAFALISRTASNSTTRGYGFLSMLQNPYTSADSAITFPAGQVLGGTYTPAKGSVLFAKLGGPFCWSYQGGSVSAASGVGGPLQYPNSGDGTLYISRAMILANDTYRAVRGWLRGLWFWGHNASNVNDRDTLNGAGDLSAKAWIAVKSVVSAQQPATSSYYNGGAIWLETSTPENHT